MKITLEDKIARVEQLLLPEFPGYHPRVEIKDKDGTRKRRKDMSVDKWDPASGKIEVYFEPVAESLPALDSRMSQAPTRKDPKPAPQNPLHELVRALDRTESKPGLEFVSLKWFRDVVLSAIGPEWADADRRHNLMREAIEKRLVLISRVPNPKSPQFPVTAIRLNRLLPETMEILGAASTLDPEFRPVGIRGEPLSTTILRERR